MASNLASVRLTGHLQVKGVRGQRAFYALWRDAEGRHQRRLGYAHVKDSGRRTPRGAVIWRSGEGPKPSGSHLTPKEAEDRLEEILGAAQRRRPDPSPGSQRSFEEACEEWLRYVEHDKQRAPSTLRDYRNTVRSRLLPGFGADTPLARIATADVDAYRERALAERRLSRRTLQKELVLLHGILKRAKRKGWIAANPAEDAERITFVRSGDFSVLTSAEVAALARAAVTAADAAIFTTASFTGLRLGELRALRWSDVDFDKRLVHVRHSFTRTDFGRPKSQRVRSVPLIDQVATALDGLSRRELFVGADDLVFPSETGAPLGDSALRKRFHAARERAELKPLRFHDLRHTFGTLAVQVFPLTDVKAYMGHQHVETTMIYVHHVPQHAAAQRLGGAVADAMGAGTSEAVAEDQIVVLEQAGVRR